MKTTQLTLATALVVTSPFVNAITWPDMEGRWWVELNYETEGQDEYACCVLKGYNQTGAIFEYDSVCQTDAGQVVRDGIGTMSITSGYDIEMIDHVPGDPAMPFFIHDGSAVSTTYWIGTSIERIGPVADGTFTMYKLSPTQNACQ